MNILSALKRSVKVATAVGHTPLGYENPIIIGKNSVSRGKRRKKWHMSPSATARIAKAQRARWVKVKAAKKNT